MLFANFNFGRNYIVTREEARQKATELVEKMTVEEIASQLKYDAEEIKVYAKKCTNIIGSKIEIFKYKQIRRQKNYRNNKNPLFEFFVVFVFVFIH